MSSKISLHRKLRFLFKPHRYKVLFGGRGGGKSHGIARALLVLGMRQRHRILCTREFQTSIRDSVHRVLSDLVHNFGLSCFYDVGNNAIVGANGTEFLFLGLRHNINSIRSVEGVTIAWCEEAQSLSNTSLDILIPTIREPGSEIWFSMNPELESDPVYRRFILKHPPDAEVIEIGWQDNPWLSEELQREKDYLYSVDAEAAEHVWGGKLSKRSKAEIFGGKWVVEAFEPENDWHGPYQGVDWGFSSHPTALVRCWIGGTNVEPELYIENEAYGVGIDNDELPEFFDQIEGARKYVTRADNARPETISHMKRHGYPRMGAAPKWAGSVEDGIAHMRSYKRIVIHPRCKAAQHDFSLYKYKQDAKTGDVLPIIIKLHDDVPDALRYALAPLIKVPQRPVVEVLDP